jgi:hypothetical protein
MRHLLLVILLLLTGGCGGGSGASNLGTTPAIMYAGKSAQATITADNAYAIFAGIWGGGFTTSSASMSPDGHASTVRNIDPLAKASRLLSRHASAQLSAGGPSPHAFSSAIQSVQRGINSGTVTYSGEKNTDGTGHMNIVYSNYNDGDGHTYDGTCAYAVGSYDTRTGTVTASLLTMVILTDATASGTVSMAGTIATSIDVAKVSRTEIHNVVAQDARSHKTTKLENYTVTKIFDSLQSPTTATSSVSGRIYLPDYGYVDLSQSVPFNYNHYNESLASPPESGGPEIIAGAGGTKLRFTPVSISRFQLDLDADGDGSYELSHTSTWVNYGGTPFTFEKVLSADTFYVGSAQPTTDGGYIVTGAAVTGTNGRSALSLVKVNAVGELLWEKKFGGAKSEIGKSVLATADGGYLAAGYSRVTDGPLGYAGEEIHLVKTDADGNLVWEQHFSGDSQWANTVKQAADGGFIVMGGITTAKMPYLLKVSATGEKQWDMRVAAPHGTPSSFDVAADGGYIIVGYTDTTWQSTIYVVKTDPSGNVTWQKTIAKSSDARALSVLAPKSGGYVVAGYAGTGYLAGLDPSGTLVWEKSFETASKITCLAEASDGGYILGADTFTGSAILLVKTDAQGTPQWQRSFDGLQYTFWPASRSVAVGLDGGYLLAGAIDARSNQNDVYLIKTDMEGNVR